MLAASASLLNIDIVFLDKEDDSPAKQIVSSPAHLGHIDGSFSNAEKIKELAAKVDILTVEIEHVNVDILDEVQRSMNVEVHPSPNTIRIIQDKLTQKRHLRDHKLAVADYIEVESSVEGVKAASELLGLPLMLKSRTLAYDGRGNYVVKDLSKAQDAIAALGDRPLYAERLVSLAKEIAVMVVKSTSGEVRSYPAVETVHKDNICHLVFAPLRSRHPALSKAAQTLAERAVMTLDGAGVFGVEMFLLENGTYHLLHTGSEAHLGFFYRHAPN